MSANGGSSATAGPTALHSAAVPSAARLLCKGTASAFRSVAGAVNSVAGAMNSVAGAVSSAAQVFNGTCGSQLDHAVAVVGCACRCCYDSAGSAFFQTIGNSQRSWPCLRECSSRFTGTVGYSEYPCDYPHSTL